jgi:outer membrane receptor protein involved in Fe transport
MKQNEIATADIYQAIWAVFAEDQFKATDKLSVVLGARYDKNTLMEGRVSPRGGILYTIKHGHVVMLSATQAFRNPNLLESYFDYTTALPIIFPATQIIIGNKNLNPESVTSYQAEYRANFSKKIHSKLGAFYNYYSDFIISPSVYQFYPANTLYAGQPANTIPQSITTNFANGGQAENVGAEISVNAMLCEWLSGMVNYTYAQTKDFKDNPTTALIEETDYIRQDCPKNTVNAALSAKFNNGISAFLGANWVDSTVYNYESATFNGLINLKAYTITNARLGYLFKNNIMEISLAAFNLFDQNVYEALPGAGLLPAGELSLSEMLGRRVTAKVSYKF